MARLNEAMNRALHKAEGRETFANLGATPAGGTPDEFGTLIKAQVAHWGKIVRESGIKMPQ